MQESKKKEFWKTWGITTNTSHNFFQQEKSTKSTNATEWDQWPICFKLIWHKYEHSLELFQMQMHVQYTARVTTSCPDMHRIQSLLLAWAVLCSSLLSFRSMHDGMSGADLSLPVCSGRGGFLILYIWFLNHSYYQKCRALEDCAFGVCAARSSVPRLCAD